MLLSLGMATSTTTAVLWCLSTTTGLVNHHQFVNLDLQDPQDLDPLILNHLWRSLPSWPWDPQPPVYTQHRCFCVSCLLPGCGLPCMLGLPASDILLQCFRGVFALPTSGWCLVSVLVHPSSVPLCCLSVQLFPATGVLFRCQPPQFGSATCHTGAYPSMIIPQVPPPCWVSVVWDIHSAGHQWGPSSWCIPGGLLFPPGKQLWCSLVLGLSPFS